MIKYRCSDKGNPCGGYSSVEMNESSNLQDRKFIYSVRFCDNKYYCVIEYTWMTDPMREGVLKLSEKATYGDCKMWLEMDGNGNFVEYDMDSWNDLNFGANLNHP